jgi:hypothetical protein
LDVLLHEFGHDFVLLDELLLQGGDLAVLGVLRPPGGRGGVDERLAARSRTCLTQP